MAYIAPARDARKIAARHDGRGLDIFASVHVTCDRLPERVAHLVPTTADLDRWMVATIYRALIAKTATQTASKAFYADPASKRDDDCFYAVAEVAPGYSVCIVFAMQGCEITIITVLRPLTQSGQKWQRGSDARRKPMVANAGGQARQLPAHRRAA